MNRAEIIDAIWKETEHKVFISKREFVASLDGCELAARELGGVIVGATLINGPEFHFVTFGQRKPFTRALMADCIMPVLKKHGFVRTRTPKEDSRQHRFNLLVGFKVESADEYFTYFRMDHFNLRGVTQCLLSQ